MESTTEKYLVLLVQPETITRMAIVDLLGLCEFEVVSVEDCKSAIVQLAAPQSKPFNLVLIDFVLSGDITTIDLLFFMKSDIKLQHIPTVITTTHNDQEMRQKCLDSGAVDYLIMPIRVNQVQELYNYIKEHPQPIFNKNDSKQALKIDSKPHHYQQFQQSDFEKQTSIHTAPLTVDDIFNSDNLDRISLETADRLCNNVIDSARKNNYSDIAVCVVDASGNPIVSKRMDLCTSALIPTLAYQKAYTCTQLQVVSTRELSRKYTPAEIKSHQKISNQHLTTIFGGILIRQFGNSGKILGAVGVGGCETTEQDEICCIQGLKKSGIL